MNRYGLYISLIALTAGLAACIDDSSTTSGDSTAVVAKGTITGFGSIYVNGVRFETDTASFDVDDAAGTQSNLAVGMVVTVQGTVDANGTTGKATSVVFDDEVEGPVAALSTATDGLSKSFTVLGKSVVVDSVSTVFKNTDFTSLADGDIVEISGYFGAGGLLQATYVEKTTTLSYGTSEVELKGTVSNLAADTFTLNGITVSFDPTGSATDLSEIDGGTVANGAYVEVQGVIDSASSMTATRIESESEGVGDDGDEVSLEGVITDYVDNSNFKVSGQRVDASRAELKPADLTLADGMQIEVEGSISGTTLIAEDIETRDDEIEIAATVSGIDTVNRTVTLQLFGDTVTVGTDNRTLMDDETNAVSRLTFNDLTVGDYVEIEGHMDGSNVVATHIQRDDVDDQVLKGPVDNFVPGTSITILGITVDTSLSTQFEGHNDASMTSNSFYTGLSTGDIVEMEDNHPADGTADKVKLDD